MHRATAALFACLLLSLNALAAEPAATEPSSAAPDSAAPDNGALEKGTPDKGAAGSEASAEKKPPSIESLVKKLNAGKAEEQHAAADALADLGEEAAEAVPALTEALKSEDVELRWRAARALSAIGPSAEPAIDAIIGVLDDDDHRVRGYGAYALGNIGKPAMKAVPKLGDLVVDEHVLVRRAAIRAFRRIDPPAETAVPVMIKVLEDADPSIVAPALHSLAEDAEEALPRLIKALENKKARFWVVRILEEMGPKARTAVPALYDQLSDENPEIRMHALIALGKIGADTKAIGMKALDLLLNDPSPAVRYSAAYAIVQLRPVGSVEALRTTAQSDDEFLKMLSMWGLAMLNPSDTEQMKKAVELLVQGMESDLPHVRAAAARGLVQLDAPKEIARPYILAAFRKADPVIIANVIDAVSGLGAEAVPKVVRVIEEEPILRIPALRVIQRIGPEAADAVPALVDILKQGDPKSEDDDDLNRAAVEALAAIGPKAEEAVDPMLEIFKDPAKKDLRYGAGYVLGSIGPAAAKAAPALEAALQSDDPFLKLVSAWALVQVKPDSQAAADKALPILLAGLDHERADVRVEVIRSLASIKQHAERIRPKLQEALKDPKPEVRAAASQALKMLGMG